MLTCEFVENCFLFLRKNTDPLTIPSYKFIKVQRLKNTEYKEKGTVDSGTWVLEISLWNVVFKCCKPVSMKDEN